MKKYSLDELEQMLSDSHQRDVELRRLFDAYTDPRDEFWGLVNVLGSIQKAHADGDWIAHVNDVMQAMCLHDAGQFPPWWFDEIEGGRDD